MQRADLRPGLRRGRALFGSRGFLQSAGKIRAGERVALICSNRMEFIEIFLGCAWLGAVLVPINVASRGPQLQHILSNSGARLLIIEGDCAENLAMLDPAALSVEAIWSIDAAANIGMEGLKSDPMPKSEGGASPIPLRPGDLAVILYTSGTTGPSKGVCCPHAQYFWWAVNTGAALELRADDVLCTTLPLFHTNALNAFYQAILVGGTIRFEKRFSASGFYSALSQHRATVTYCARRHGSDPVVPSGLSPEEGKRTPRGFRLRRACRSSSTLNSYSAPESA